MIYFSFRKVAGAFRVMAGRHSVEPNLTESLKTRNHSHDHLFCAKTLMLEEKKKRKNSDVESESESEGDETCCEDENCRYVERVGVRLILFIIV